MGGGAKRVSRAANELDAQKRGVYDITSVPEGIGLIETKAKNNRAKHHIQRQADHREVNCNWAGSETEPETGRLRNPQWW